MRMGGEPAAADARVIDPDGCPAVSTAITRSQDHCRDKEPWWCSAAWRVFAIDLRSLAALRIAVALILLLDLAIRAGDLTAHYSDGGVMPRSAVIDNVLESSWCPSIHFISGAAPVEAALFILAAIFAVALLAGYRTKPATIASWFLLLSLHNRNPMILQGGDVLLRMLLFWGMFLPLGARFSMDAHSRSASTTEQSASGVLSIASAAMLLQLGFVYWFSMLLKTDPVWTRDFTAVYYALSLDHFVTPIGKLLLPHGSLLKALTVGTLCLESFGPLLALAAGLLKWPARIVIVISFVAFHAMMGICLKLGLFSLICSAAWLAFIPTGFWTSRFCGSPAFARLFQALERIFTLNGASPLHSPESKSPLSRVPGHWRNIVAQVIAAFFLLYVSIWNLRTTNPESYTKFLPHSLDWIGHLSGVTQCWDMFSPSPLKQDGWFVIPAQLADGSEVDVFRKGAPVRWEKPKLVSAMYKNDRWRKYMVLLGAAANADRRLYFARYLCQRWNKQHPPEQHIRTLQIYLMEEDTLPDYRVSQPKLIVLWKHQCFD